MFCVIYKSPKKNGTYLYIKNREDFSDVPEPLLEIFGKPILVTIVNLAQKQKLAGADIDKVKENLVEHGFYLQLPPPTENLLEVHLANEKAKRQQQSGANDE